MGSWTFRAGSRVVVWLGRQATKPRGLASSVGADVFSRRVLDMLQTQYEDFYKLEKGPTDKAKEPDPDGTDQQNLGYKKLKNRKTDRTVGLNYCIS